MKHRKSRKISRSINLNVLFIYIAMLPKRFLYQILISVFLMYQILANYCKKKNVKIILCDFLDFCFRFRHSQLKSTYGKNCRTPHALWVGKPARSAVCQILVLPTVCRWLSNKQDICTSVRTDGINANNGLVNSKWKMDKNGACSWF